MKYKGERSIKEVPLINLLRKEDLRKLNAIFNTTYHPEKLRSIVWATIVQSLEQVEHDEISKDIDKLMRQKPIGGGYV